MFGKENRLKFFLFELLLIAIGLSACAAEDSFIRTPSMLAAYSAIAGRIAGLTWFMVILGSLIFIGVIVYLAYAIWGHRSYPLEEELKRPNEGSGIVLTWGGLYRVGAGSF